MKTGIELIADERREQIEKHGRTIQRDAGENSGMELEQAALYILMNDYDEDAPEYYPENWGHEFMEAIPHKSRKERLVIAAALLAAEIDRLNYIEESN